MTDMHQVVGRCDILFLTLDTLRYDVAHQLLVTGQLPHFAAVLPERGWEKRHSPGNFTYAAHQSFFAGFLPTPTRPGKHPRLFATRFVDSTTVSPQTFVFDAPDIVSGLAGVGYHTVCIGGVGFFDKQTPLSRVLPSMFAESHWAPHLGVRDPHSTEHQVALAEQILDSLPSNQRLFLFINVSALHQPNYFYLPNAVSDTRASHAAALTYVDSQVPRLFAALRRRGPTFCIVCSDHGTAYGEGGYTGHRVGHPVVWIVPYAEFVI